MTRFLAVASFVLACAAPPPAELTPAHPASPQAAEAPEPPRSRTLDAEGEPAPAPTPEASHHDH
jgi:hypothetical protein